MSNYWLKKNCPLKFLSKHTNKIKPHQLTLSDLDKLARRYLKLPEPERSIERREIFSKLNPFLLKSLKRYCNMTTACELNCNINGLLSTAFILFTELIDKFDPERNVNFLGYAVNRLSWGIFNSHRYRSQYYERHLELNPNLTDEHGDIEERWLSSIEIEEFLACLRPHERDLFVLHYLFGYSYKELAALQNTNANIIQKRIAQIRRSILKNIQ